MCKVNPMFILNSLLSVANLGGHARAGTFLFQFHAVFVGKNGQIIGLLLHLWRWSPLENPGSVNDFVMCFNIVLDKTLPPDK